MTAIVFCLACQKVMNMDEYIHAGHRCVNTQHRPNHLSPSQQRAWQYALDDQDDAS